MQLEWWGVFSDLNAKCQSRLTWNVRRKKPRQRSISFIVLDKNFFKCKNPDELLISFCGRIFFGGRSKGSGILL